MFKPFSSVTKCFKMILILLGSSLLNSSITFFDKFQIYESYLSSQMLRFLVLCFSTNICRDLRDCPTGRESRSVPTLFVSRGTGTGTEVCGTSGTGTDFRGTVPHGCPAGQAGPGQKIAGLSRPVSCTSLILRSFSEFQRF